MKPSIILFSSIFAAGIVQVSQAQQSRNGSFSTPSYNGQTASPRQSVTGTATTRTNNSNVNSNAFFGTSLGTNSGRSTSTNLTTSITTNNGAIIGQPNTALGLQSGTALTPGGPAISAGDSTNAVQPRGIGTAVTVNSNGTARGSIGLGQQGTIGIGQQGTIGIGQQGTTGIGQPGTPAAGQPQQNNIAGRRAAMPLTNAFIINTDGTVTGLPAQGGTADSQLTGTNRGSASGTNRITTTRTNRFNSRR
jgi:hypothetical protein